MKVADPLDPVPFRRWADAWIERYRAGDDGATKILEGGGTTALGLALFPDDTEETGARKLWRWRFENQVLDRGAVEAALDNLDLFLWEVYDDEGFCTHCDQRVNTQPDGRCLICGTRTARAMSRRERGVRLGLVCPKCDGPKSRGALRCRDCNRAIVVAGRRGAEGRIVASRFEPEDYRCSCGNKKQPSARSCWSCYAAAGSHTGRRNAKGDHTLQKISEEVLAEAYEMYKDGLSLRKVAAAVFDRTTYASPRSAAVGIGEAFARRGWPRRGREEAVVAMNKNRAKERGLPFCTFVKADGSRCDRRTSKGRCWHHREENLKPRLKMLHARQRERAAA